MSDNQPLESELMPDPLNDRVMSIVPRPPNVPLSKDRLYTRQGAKRHHHAPNAELIKNY